MQGAPDPTFWFFMFTLPTNFPQTEQEKKISAF